MLRRRSHPVSDDEKTFLGTVRMEALTDGVIAIVMTLLVLELKVPEASLLLLPQRLFEMWPTYASYAASFVMLGVYWSGHVTQSNLIRFSDRTLIWLNLAFLFAVSLLPFTTALLSRYWGFPLASMLYGLNLIVIGIIAYGNWCYATTHHRLVDHTLSQALVSMAKRRILVAPAVSLVAVALAFVAPRLSIAFYALIPVYYILPGRIDAFWSRPAVAHDD